MRWNYYLNTEGAFLRKTINNGGEDLESCKNTLSALLACYKKIEKLLPEYEYFNFEDASENVESNLALLNEPDDAEREDRLLEIGYTGYNPPIEMVNESLFEFYDLCDRYSIWIGL